MALDTIVYQSPLVSIGAWRLAPQHALWSCENQIGNGPLLVFPRVAVWIHPADRPAVVASPNDVMLYNARQPYRRGLISERGDECEWFNPSQDLLHDALRSVDPAAAERPLSPFRVSQGPCPPQAYLRQRMIYEHVTRRPRPDPLVVETLFLETLDAVLIGAMPRQHRTVTPEGRAAVHAAKALLTQRRREAISLHQLAAETGFSAFHLSRLFRALVGIPPHRFQTRARLRLGLERLSDPRTDLLGLSLDLGFSDHSHFTNAFRREFGLPPSQVRRAATKGLLRELEARLADR